MEIEQNPVGLRNRHRIEIKVSAEEKELIMRGAALANKGVSEFVRTAAQNAARELISKTSK